MTQFSHIQASTITKESTNESGSIHGSNFVLFASMQSMVFMLRQPHSTRFLRLAT